MERDGVLELPPPTRLAPRRRPIPATAASDPPECAPSTRLEDLRPLRAEPLRPRDPRGRLWNEYIKRYHHLGYTPLPGAQLRYVAYSARDGPVALFGFGTGAWKITPRNQFVGWAPATRERNLAAVVNNARYLVLPWYRVPSLTSHLLSQVTRRLPRDWFQRYRGHPVLPELFWEVARDRAANWIHVGQAQGHGNLDVHKRFAPPSNTFS